ncbi:hypothetical protein NDR87_28210 [Nocardia sp. CDC159]|uniref:Uncharacterized protein n=1 Tax=Nocardia pulmonis TaxID=2951408 RepID=A0A9X2EAY7_9NOCA|nr:MULTISPECIES: hypothetical protein [Nocardia]MCM6777377.1 hypothetical protein [Nocardia pulmonis]MCM6790262.1 hypothetical protein [Nocardia sp. CDC159]
MDKPRPLSDEHREEFWRRMGWSEDLPESERRAIEERWDDESIELAEIFGW